MSNPFLETTTVTRVGDGHYRGFVDGSWNLRPLPQGGVVAAVALRAIEEQLGDPVQRLRGFHTTFAAQVTDGPVDVEVEVIRRGRSMSQVRAELTNPGQRRGHLTTAVHGAPRRGFEFTDVSPPVGVPRPADCPSFRDPPPPEAPPFEPLPFWTERVEGRPAIGHAPWEDYEPDRAERAGWYRFDDPPFLDDGSLDPLALVVLTDFMPGAVREKLGPGPEWFAPSVDLTVHLLGECRSPWVLAHNRARHAGEGYASAEITLWDCGEDGAGDPTLVAYATQLFLFTFVD